MRKAMQDELNGISQYIKSVSEPTEVNFFDMIQDQTLHQDQNRKCTKIDISKTSQKHIDPVYVDSDFSNEMKDTIRDIQISTLAILIDQFSYNYDAYEYHDTVEDRESQVKKIEDDIRNGNTEYLQDFLNTVILDGIEDIDDSEVMRNVKTAQELSKVLFILNTSDRAEIIKTNVSSTSYKDVDSDLSSDIKNAIIDDIQKNMEYDEY